MIVRYVRERGYEGDGKDPNVTLGKDYVVLGVTFRKNNGMVVVEIRCDNDGYPGVFDLKFFDIVSSAIPDDFSYQDNENVSAVRPKEFVGNFWDDFHDGDEAAEALFEQVYVRLEEFHGLR